MKKILIVEDESAIRETISEILQFSNYEVIKAQDGKVGYEKAIETYPDLVICDMMMPRMNGIDTIKAFRNHSSLKHIPFIFLSAMSELSDIRKGMNLGAEDYLTKPFQPKELLATIALQFKKVRKNKELYTSTSSHQTEKELADLKYSSAINEQKWIDCLKSAANIQCVILPKFAELNESFSENFIYFKPKYSVSGDFYWVQNFGDSKLIAVADCTGHGISASLLTICCYNGLNLAVKHYGLRKPKEILEKVNELVLNFMQEHGRSHNEVGMDILICAINKKDKTINYAGAKRPLYIVTNNLDAMPNKKVIKYNQKQGKPLHRIKGSLFTIGSTNKNVKLTEQTINYQSGDMIYLSSDGYADQFGGVSDKCFKSINLIQLLMSIQGESMKEQKHILAQNLNQWKGDREQTDDITIMGIRL
jgi:CheY-like chemotaxis protein